MSTNSRVRIIRGPGVNQNQQTSYTTPEYGTDRSNAQIESMKRAISEYEKHQKARELKRQYIKNLKSPGDQKIRSTGTTAQPVPRQYVPIKTNNDTPSFSIRIPDALKYEPENPTSRSAGFCIRNPHEDDLF